MALADRDFRECSRCPDQSPQLLCPCLCVSFSELCDTRRASFETRLRRLVRSSQLIFSSDDVILNLCLSKKNEGQTIRPVRSEGLARERKAVEFDLGDWEMPWKNAKSDHMQSKSLTWIARVMEERTENVSGCCRGLAHPSKAERERHAVSRMPFRDWCRHSVAGLER